MLHVGLDLSRKSVEVQILAEDGITVPTMMVPPDLDGMRGLLRKVGAFPVGDMSSGVDAGPITERVAPIELCAIHKFV
jgi:hypothetical protein